MVPHIAHIMVSIPKPLIKFVLIAAVPFYIISYYLYMFYYYMTSIVPSLRFVNHKLKVSPDFISASEAPRAWIHKVPNRLSVSSGSSFIWFILIQDRTLFSRISVPLNIPHDG